MATAPSSTWRSGHTSPRESSRKRSGGSSGPGSWTGWGTTMTLTRDTDRYRRATELRERAHRVIPGGTHKYAKGDDQYPVLAPGIIERVQGCHGLDVDG